MLLTIELLTTIDFGRTSNTPLLS